jgi:hypothetical protein
MFQMSDETHLAGLKAIFLSLAESKVAKVSLKDTGLISVLDGAADLEFVLLSRVREPTRTVRKVRDTLLGPLFEFRRHDEGWYECAELLDGLKGPGHQYLSRGLSDDALVMVSYKEYSGRKEGGDRGGAKANTRRK